MMTCFTIFIIIGCVALIIGQIIEFIERKK